MIRNLANLNKTRIEFYSIASAESANELGLEVLCNDFIRKPIIKSSLLQVIENVIIGH